jgi:hypothetical protein
VICLLVHFATAQASAAPIYFGYVGSGWVGGGDSNGAQIADHGNVTWIYAGDPSDTVNRILAARANGLKVVLDVEEVFFHTRWTAPSSPSMWWTLRLEPGACGTYAAVCRWTALYDAIVSSGTFTDLVGIYHMDEPFHRASDKAATIVGGINSPNFPSQNSAEKSAMDSNIRLVND